MFLSKTLAHPRRPRRQLCKMGGGGGGRRRGKGIMDMEMPRESWMRSTLAAKGTRRIWYGSISAPHTTLRREAQGSLGLAPRSLPVLGARVARTRSVCHWAGPSVVNQSHPIPSHPPEFEHQDPPAIVPQPARHRSLHTLVLCDPKHTPHHAPSSFPPTARERSSVGRLRCRR